MGGKRVAGAALDGVNARIGRFHDDIADIVNDVTVVPGAANQGIRAPATIQIIVAVETGQHVSRPVPDDPVIQVVSGAIDRVAADQGQVLDSRTYRMSDAGEYLVDAAAIGFIGYIADVIDIVLVIAFAAGHDVRAQAAIQGVIALMTQKGVIAVISKDDIAIGIAAAGQIGRAGQGQVLQIRPQRIINAGHNGIDAAEPGIGGGLDDRIADIIDDIGIVTAAAFHHVRPGTAIQEVVTILGEQVIISIQAMHPVGCARAHQHVVSVRAREIETDIQQIPVGQQRAVIKFKIADRKTVVGVIGVETFDVNGVAAIADPDHERTEAEPDAAGVDARAENQCIATDAVDDGIDAVALVEYIGIVAETPKQRVVAGVAVINVAHIGAGGINGAESVVGARPDPEHLVDEEV